MYLIMFVLNNPDQLQDVLQAWKKKGVRGATIIESTGFHRVLRASVHMRYFFQTSTEVEEGHYTLFVLVEKEQDVWNCLQATEQVVGDLDKPNTGVFAAWPVTIVKGLPTHQGETERGLD